MYKLTAACAISILLVACNKPCPEPAKEVEKKEITKADLKDMNDKLNYSVAYDVGRSAGRNKLELKEEIFLKGVIDGMSSESGLTNEEDKDTDNGLLNDKERIEIKREHSKQLREQAKKEREEKAAENKKKADEFLAKNKTKEGVITTESGLQYKIIKKGDGEIPKAEDRVSVNYKGTLINGTEFDSSYKRNRPATFPVGRVVKGWTEALQLMPVGSKWQLFLSPELGYGERGAGSKIDPNSALIFEIELLEILKEDDKAGGPGATKPAAKPAPKKPAAKAAAPQ